MKNFAQTFMLSIMLGFGLLTAGCLPAATKEQLVYSTQRDWARLKNTDWAGVGQNISGLGKVPLTDEQKAIRQVEQNCAVPLTRQRQITQNGIYDAIDYSQCPGDRAAPTLGQRLAPKDM